LIAGNGHVRKDIGVPKLIGVSRTGASMITIGLSEGRTDYDLYDVVGVTAGVDRPDPCLQLREHFKSASKGTTSE